MKKAPVHIGIGGWTYGPWRDNFYPKGLPHARELEYAASHVTAIEINGTYYRLQSRDSFRKWADAVPKGFIFTVKASRFCTNRRVLAEAGESVAKFLDQGLTELGDALGPILWQFMPTKQFDPEDFAAFVSLLPSDRDGVRLRHALEVRHESFRDERFYDLARKAGAAIVLADSADYPRIEADTADFVYARLQDAQADEPTGYPPDVLDRWAETIAGWAPRETFLFMINGAKERAPAAAMALIERL